LRLLIQEYLGMLKEDNELDAVVRDLVSSMGFDVISVPQKGTRQDGVDIHAVGIDPVDKIKKNFLITIKKGKIDRNIWDAPKQGVLASLHDIIYVYVKTKIGPSEKNLPIKIILCCGGELKQEVQSNWTGFQGKHTEFEFDLWNGSKLSGLIEEYLLDEKIFLEDVQKKMRRTLVVLPDPDYDLSHYKLLIENLLFNDNWKELSPERLEGQA
jgi:hypothetical protein